MEGIKGKLKILFKNYKNCWKVVFVYLVLVLLIIVANGLAQKTEAKKVAGVNIFKSSNPYTQDNNSEKPLHRSLNTDYVKVVVTYTSNTAPTVATPILNGGAAITVVGNTSTTVVGTTTISDTNGWADISSATSTLYRQSATTCNSGATAARWCYAPTCTLLNVTTTNSRDASCTTDVWFLAEPTSGTSSYTGQWQMDIMVKDAANATGFGSTSQELGSIYYIDASDTIAYGTVALGATSSDKLTTIYNAGNVPFDPWLSGVNMAGGGATIAVGQQKYSSSSLGNWVGTALTGTPTGYNIDLATPTATTTDSKDDVYWMIKIPDTQQAANYYGTNTVSAGDAM